MAGLSHMWPNNAFRVIAREGLTLDEWNHIAFTYDGSSRAAGAALYINGKRAEVDILRDNLYRDIIYERETVNLTLGYRFRDKGFKDGALDELKVFDRKLTAIEIAQLAGLDSDSNLQDAHLRDYYFAHHDNVRARTHRELTRLRKQKDELLAAIPEIMVMKEMSPRRPTYVLNRGAYDNKGEEVAPGTPEQILPFDEELPANRLGLASWLSHPAHPLTARVTVNRYWQLLFGQGIVSTPEDFGNQGALPSHPELLDWLATTFIESGWDLKDLIKRLAMSAVYRQTSYASDELIRLDPQNELLARGPSFRLTAEMLRDQALSASGLLVDKKGGPPVKPYQPPGLWKEKSGQTYVQDSGDDLYRRSLYTFWKRTSPPPAMITFDATERNQCIVRRQRTSSPLQALVLLNDPQFVEASRKLAERLLLLPASNQRQRLTAGFRLLTARHPSDAEIEVLEKILEEQRQELSATPDGITELLATGDAPTNPDLDRLNLATWSILASTIMNTDAAIMRR